MGEQIRRMTRNDKLGVVLHEAIDELLGVVMSGAGIGANQHWEAALDDGDWPMEHIGRRIGFDCQATQFFDFERGLVGRGVLQPAPDTDGGG